MPGLVALHLGGGPAFVDALVQAWDAGDAVAPVDPRLPAPEVARVLRALRPTALLRADGSRQELHDGMPVEDGDAVVIATSGSTGEPKAVVLTHDAVAASAQATSDRLGVDPQRHHWLACLPLAHIGGLSVVTRALCTGTPLTVLDRFRADEVTALGRHGPVTHVSLVPTALGRVPASAFRCILLGGAAPPGSLPDNVVTTYGMTETGSGLVYDGRPLDGVSVAVGTGRPGEGAPGEVLVRGPMLLRAYRDRPAGFVAGPDGAGGWLPTGDGGRLVGDGDDTRLVVDGRLAEVVVTGGEKVWPAAVERVLAGHRAVAEVAVWKRPDPEWGERVVAWVVPTPGEAPPRLEELRERVAQELATWAAPKELVVVGRLPRTRSGKVRRSALP